MNNDTPEFTTPTISEWEAKRPQQNAVTFILSNKAWEDADWLTSGGGMTTDELADLVEAAISAEADRREETA